MGIILLLALVLLTIVLFSLMDTDGVIICIVIYVFFISLAVAAYKSEQKKKRDILVQDAIAKQLANKLTNIKLEHELENIICYKDKKSPERAALISETVEFYNELEERVGKDRMVALIHSAGLHHFAEDYKEGKSILSISNINNNERMMRILLARRGFLPQFDAESACSKSGVSYMFKIDGAIIEHCGHILERDHDCPRMIAVESGRAGYHAYRFNI